MFSKFIFIFRISYPDSSTYYYNCCSGRLHVSIPKEEEQECKISRCRFVITWVVLHKRSASRTTRPPVSF